MYTAKSTRVSFWAARITAFIVLGLMIPVTNASYGYALKIKEAFVTFNAPNADFPDFGIDTITIRGRRLNNGHTVRVKFGKFSHPLRVLQHKRKEIIVECPPDPGNNNRPTCINGDFLLSVSTGYGYFRQDSWNLTVGAVGPQGPQGEAGPAGQDGQDGATGPRGEPGPQGARTAGADRRDRPARPGRPDRASGT